MVLRFSSDVFQVFNGFLLVFRCFSSAEAAARAAEGLPAAAEAAAERPTDRRKQRTSAA